MVKLKRKTELKNALKSNEAKIGVDRNSDTRTSTFENDSKQKKYDPFATFLKENPNCTIIDNGDGTYDFIDG